MKKALHPLSIMVIYGASLLLLTGRIGFWGDAWTLFSFGYNYRWLNAMYSFAGNIRRPVEGIYVTTVYELFGANPLIFQVGSLVIHGVSCWLFGRLLTQMNPHRPQLGLAASLTAFFLPTMAGTTYLMQMDNGRLQMLLFWLSLNLWVWWLKTGLLWWRAVLALGVGVVSCFAYEAGVLLHLTLPLWLGLVWWGLPPETRQPSAGRVGLAGLVGTLTPLFFFGLARVTVLNGGLVEQRTWFPPLSNYVDYTLKAADSWLMGARTFPPDAATLILGLVVGSLTAGLFWQRGLASQPQPVYEKWGLLGLSFALFILGGIPFFWAGGDNFIGGRDFISPIRLYTAGGYGVALFLAWGMTSWQPPRLQLLANGAGIIFISLGAMYHAQLRHDWQNAATLRTNIWQNLVTAVPNVTPETTFLLLNFDSSEGQAAVIAGETGTQHYVRMLYDNPTVFAHFVYLQTADFDASEGRMVLVLPEGVVARGRPLTEPAQLDELVIVLREGETVRVLDAIHPEDTWAADWGEFTGSLETNQSRIIPASAELQAHQQTFLGH